MGEYKNIGKWNLKLNTIYKTCVGVYLVGVSFYIRVGIMLPFSVCCCQLWCHWHVSCAVWLPMLSIDFSSKYWLYFLLFWSLLMMVFITCSIFVDWCIYTVALVIVELRYGTMCWLTLIHRTDTQQDAYIKSNEENLKTNTSFIS
jgi:hypothetical protein